MAVRRRLHPALVLGLLLALVSAGVVAVAQPRASAAPSAATSAADRPAVALPSPWAALVSLPALPGGRQPDVAPLAGTYATLDRAVLEQTLASAPAEAVGGVQQTVPLQLLAPDGRLRTFAVHLAPVMEPGLAAAHPEIRTWAGQSVDDPASSVRLDLGPLGFHASVRGGEPSWYVDPVYAGSQATYVSYLRSALADTHGSFAFRDMDEAEAVGQQAAAAAAVAGPTVVLRTYRLALLSDPTYAAYWDGKAGTTPGTAQSDSTVLAAKVTLMNRVNQVYENDLAIHMNLITGSDKLNLDTSAKATGANGPCGEDACYSADDISSCGGGTLSQNEMYLPCSNVLQMASSLFLNFRFLMAG